MHPVDDKLDPSQHSLGDPVDDKLDALRTYARDHREELASLDSSCLKAVFSRMRNREEGRFYLFLHRYEARFTEATSHGIRNPFPKRLKITRAVVAIQLTCRGVLHVGLQILAGFEGSQQGSIRESYGSYQAIISES